MRDRMTPWTLQRRQFVAGAAALATATLAAGFSPLTAQAADADAGAVQATDLDKVQVRGSWFAPSSPKFTAELLDTPKSVAVVTEKTLQEIGATNLVDALRMVPGITFGAGEGGKWSEVRTGTTAKPGPSFDELAAEARRLGLQLGIQCIENPLQLQVAREAGADWLQGNLVGRPAEACLPIVKPRRPRQAA